MAAETETEQARRILDRVAGETEAGSILAKASAKVHRHVAARDAEAEDAIEYWGTRIGRTLGLIITVALVIWLVMLLIPRG